MLAKQALNTAHVRTAPGRKRACPCCFGGSPADVKAAKRAARRRDRQAFRNGRVEY